MHSVLLLIFWRKLSVNWTAKGNQCLHWSSSYRENSNCVSLGLPACDDLVETGTTVENKWGKVSSVHPSIYRIEKPFASAKKKKNSNKNDDNLHTMQRVSDNEYPIFRHINLFNCMAVRAMSGLAGTIDSVEFASVRKIMEIRIGL